MTCKQAPIRNGGGFHEIVFGAGLFVVLAILLSLIAFLPAPGRAADVPADAFLVGALPPPKADGFTAPFLKLANDRGIRALEDHDPAEDDTEAGIVLSPDEYRRLKQGATGLSSEEYQQFKQLISNQRATAVEVALVNLAVKGTGLLIVGLAWIGLLWILRRTFDYWFDADVYKEAWPSVAVIIALLACTALIIYAVVA